MGKKEVDFYMLDGVVQGKYLYHDTGIVLKRIREGLQQSGAHVQDIILGSYRASNSDTGIPAAGVWYLRGKGGENMYLIEAEVIGDNIQSVSESNKFSASVVIRPCNPKASQKALEDTIHSILQEKAQLMNTADRCGA